MVTKKITQLTFRGDQNPELIAKLNAVAKHQFLLVHSLAKAILLKELDKQIQQMGIDIDVYNAQSARAG